MLSLQLLTQRNTRRVVLAGELDMESLTVL